MYIIVYDKEEWKVVSDRSGVARPFKKQKAAQNFIDSRRFLSDRGAVITLSLPQPMKAFRVDL